MGELAEEVVYLEEELPEVAEVLVEGRHPAPAPVYPVRVLAPVQVGEEQDAAEK